MSKFLFPVVAGIVAMEFAMMGDTHHVARYLCAFGFCIFLRLCCEYIVTEGGE